MLDPGLPGDSVQGSGADRSMGLEQMEEEAEPFGVKDSGGPPGSMHLVICPGLNSKRDLGKRRVLLLNE